MADLIVITPSRGRPAQLAELTEAVRRTTDGRAEVFGLVDLDDPQREAYKNLVTPAGPAPYAPLRILFGPRQSLSGWTNLAARNALASSVVPPPRYLASLGDDHRPRTHGWDLKLIEAIEALPGPGFAYGRDLLQDKNMPTAWVASAEVVRALGWMMLPTCAHMYVDNAILTLGTETGRIAYRPDVIIEHLHPHAHKAEWDASYIESNADERYVVDKAAYDAWRLGQLARDTATVEALVYAEVTR